MSCMTWFFNTGDLWFFQFILMKPSSSFMYKLEIIWIFCPKSFPNEKRVFTIFFQEEVILTALFDFSMGNWK